VKTLTASALAVNNVYSRISKLTTELPSLPQCRAVGVSDRASLLQPRKLRDRGQYAKGDLHAHRHIAVNLEWAHQEVGREEHEGGVPPWDESQVADDQHIASRVRHQCIHQ